MVAYQTDPKHEAPRLYFHSDVLYSKISQRDIDARVKATIDELTAKNQRMSRSALPQKALHKLTAEYLLTRVTINTSKNVDKFLDAKFSIFLSPIEGDRLVGKHIDGQLTGVDPIVDLKIKPYQVHYDDRDAETEEKRPSQPRSNR
jgi:hypothetical protein